MNLENLRTEIEKIDKFIIASMAKREKISFKIGELKKEMGIQIYDSEREEKLNNYYRKLSEKYNLDPVFILEIFSLVIKNSRTIQKRK
ncbi:chorismate mutase [Pigmentibacter sp. JX0631]|uniref:chorismate mutase n=1 Tax=Pigmentibacter sp. JX0631 TaxID=2976982 RepID=UPI002468D53F|nr:chorismate mutase [Pigmentibacter sp. JX0631]WGL60412.1 chorismate mutase [Pigmentibacter sp. JX0631]